MQGRGKAVRQAHPMLGALPHPLLAPTPLMYLLERSLLAVVSWMGQFCVNDHCLTIFLLLSGLCLLCGTDM